MSEITKITLKQNQSFNEFIGFATFATEPSEAGKAVVINLDELKQEFDNLFSTKKYERPYLPNYYNPLDELIGELWTAETPVYALQAVIQKVNEFIPRVTVSNTTNFTYKNYKVTMELQFYFNNDFSRALYQYSRQFDIIT